MPSRRHVLATSAIGLSGLLGGCTGAFDGLTASAEYNNGITLPASGQFLAGGPTVGDDASAGHAGPAFAAQVFSTPDAVADAVDWSVLPGGTDEWPAWTDIDYDERFLAVLVTTEAVTAANESIGWCPETRVGGDQFVFEFRLESYPDPVDGDTLLVFLEQWETNGTEPSSDAVVDLRVGPDPGKQVLTCED